MMTDSTEIAIAVHTCTYRIVDVHDCVWEALTI